MNSNRIAPTFEEIKIVNLEEKVKILDRALDLAVFALWAHVDEPEERMKIGFLEEATIDVKR